MTRYMVQFWIRHRGYVWIEVHLIPRQPAKRLAAMAVIAALKAFNDRWPGARQNELVACGIMDGHGRRLDAKDLPR